MKKFTLLIILVIGVLTSCTNVDESAVRSSESTPPEYMPGDLVKTKFGNSVLIIDTVTGINTEYYGVYRVKRSDTSEVELMYAAELKQKL